MADDGRLARVVSRLQNLPAISLPTDYPRPSGSNKVVEAVHQAELSEQTALALLKLALFNENEQEDDELESPTNRPSAFHLVLTAFTVLLHRYTGDTDLVIGSSSASAREPLVLRLSAEPADPFWAILRRVQQVEDEAERDAVPFDSIVQALNKNEALQGPIFRVRFFDGTDETKEHFLSATSATSDLT
ncbi:hypothetical protein EV122DRAFT_256788, partial [Schizophyllum commune]